MYKILITISLFLFIHSTAMGQHKSKSSRMIPEKYTSIISNIDSATYHVSIQSNHSFDFIEKSLKLIGRDKKRYSRQIAQLYELLGDSYSQIEQYDLAHDNYNLAKNYTKKSIIPLELKLVKTNIFLDEYSKAKSTLESIASQYKSEEERIEYYLLMGDILLHEQEIDQALHYFNKGLTLSTLIESNVSIIQFDNRIAKVYAQSGAMELAEDHLNNSMKNVANEDISIQSKQVETNATFFRNNNKLEEEVTLRKDNIENLQQQCQTADVKQKLQFQNFSIADAYIEKKKFKDAIPYLEKCKSADELRADKEIVIQATKKLSVAYEKTGNYDEALNNYRSYVTLTDELYQTKEQEIKDAINLTKDLANKQKRIDVLELDRELNESREQVYEQDKNINTLNNTQQKLIIYSLVGGLLLSLIALFFFYKNNKQRKIANNLLALKALKSQMNPHFIFNALNSVNNFIALNDERKANKYLTDFSMLMRMVLDVSEKDFISLEEEMNLIKLYIQLEHVRFEDKFDYNIKIDDNIELSKILIPPMLIQPYLENAVWHGMRYKETLGNIRLSISKVNTNSVLISIQDDGVGRQQSQEMKSPNQLKKQSKGMSNTAERISIINKMYNQDIRLDISNLKDDNTGTIVNLYIPINTQNK